MLPFWNFWGEEKALQFEDKEKGIKGELHQKNFSGSHGSFQFKGTVQSFSVTATNPWNNLLENFNPFKYLTGFQSTALLNNANEEEK